MKIALTFLLFFPILFVKGQNKTVTGSVVDESGHPVPFASIQSKTMHTKGIVADAQGNYKLEGIANKDTLICSHINYQTRLEEVNGNNKIIFRLSKKPATKTFTGISSSARSIPVKQINNGSVNETSVPIVDDQMIFTKVEVPAHYGKEPNSFQRFIEHISFPDSTSSVAFDAFGEFTGIVVVSFTVDKTGKVSNPIVVKGVDSVLDKIIVNALVEMPSWQPAVQNGMNVASEQEVSIYLNFQQKRWQHSYNQFATRSYHDIVVEITKEKKPKKIYAKVSSAPGIDSAWIRFLERNLNGSIPFKNGAKPGKYIVSVKFLIEKDGSVADVQCLKDPGFGMCQQVLEVVKKSPRWRWRPSVE